MLATKQDGPTQFPTLEDLYSFFSPRSKKITVWSFGLDYGGFETDVMQSLGCKIQLFDHRESTAQRFDLISRVLKEHETLETDPEWASEIANKWVLPNLLTLNTSLPWSFDGKLEGADLKKMNTQDVPRVDVCKISLTGLETQIVYNILSTGYRPGLFYIHWTEHPDSSTSAMLCAGHLQNSGYKLLKAVDNYFVYIFTDQCLYESCSWARSDVANPMLEEIKQQLFPNMPAAESKSEAPVNE